MSGKYIVLEGMDCSGKSTLAKQLVARLQQLGLTVIHVAEPSTCTVATATMRELIINGEMSEKTRAMLALTQRIELLEEVIKPALARGDYVVSERNYLSTLVYQTRAGSEAVKFVHMAAFKAFGLEIYPDLLVHMEITHKEFLERLSNRLSPPDPLEEELISPVKFNKSKMDYNRVIHDVLIDTPEIMVLKTTNLEKILSEI